MEATRRTPEPMLALFVLGGRPWLFLADLRGLIALVEPNKNKLGFPTSQKVRNA
jgi:hypothetical protein